MTEEVNFNYSTPQVTPNANDVPMESDGVSLEVTAVKNSLPTLINGQNKVVNQYGVRSAITKDIPIGKAVTLEPGANITIGNVIDGGVGLGVKAGGEYLRGTIDAGVNYGWSLTKQKGDYYNNTTESYLTAQFGVGVEVGKSDGVNVQLNTGYRTGNVYQSFTHREDVTVTQSDGTTAVETITESKDVKKGKVASGFVVGAKAEIPINKEFSLTAGIETDLTNLKNSSFMKNTNLEAGVKINF